jgi:spermidine synthase/Tfp pilus assembly protein PilF
MNKTKSFTLIFVPAVTIFISSACIMILEIVAGRLIARFIGASLYTWTSVIGVVLAGISAGNYIGGRIADRFAARKVLAVLFGISSAVCVTVVVMNNLVGQWQFLWQFSLPVRIFSHILLVFLLPSTLLGMISPVVVKMALERGLPTGRTVGDIYAWSAVGSIAGTFLAGFYLIAMMGTIAIIWMIAAVMLLMSILYWPGLRVLYIWAAVFFMLIALAAVPCDWAVSLGSFCALREQPDPNIIYENESQYSYIAVQQLSKIPDERKFTWSGIYSQLCNMMVMDDITNLKDFYMRVYAAVMRQMNQDKNNPSVLVIGGGGYVFPRYIEHIWPDSRIDVIEIDPGVTEVAMQAFGLQRNTKIKTFAMDARNYVDELLNRKYEPEQIPRYDFIYEDAFDGYSVPFQLVSKEFNDKIARILSDDGVYMINLIDNSRTGNFLCSFVNTIRQTFGNVYVVSEGLPQKVTGNVIIASKQKIELKNLAMEKSLNGLDLHISNGTEISANMAKPVVLTDNYAPVENLLAPAAIEFATYWRAKKYFEQAESFERQGRLDKSISKYEAAIRVNPSTSIAAFNKIGGIYAAQGKWDQSISVANSALEYIAKFDPKQHQDAAVIHCNIAFALKKLGDNNEASLHLRQAIEEYRKCLIQQPESVDVVRGMGIALADNGDFTEAIECFQKAVDMDPDKLENYSLLTTALVSQGHYDEAIEQLQKGIRFMLNSNYKDDTMALDKLLEWVKSRKSN